MENIILSTAPVNTAPVNTAPVNTAPVNTAPASFALAAQPRPRFGLGTCTPEFILAAAPAGMRASAIARPRTASCTDSVADAVGQFRALALAGHRTEQQSIGTKCGYTTLIIASGDGEVGSHPAREPV